jgi:hypothetical protein
MSRWLDAFPPASLDEVAELQDRVDVKYVLPLATFDALVEPLRTTHSVLEIGGRREFGYRSLYFDTPELQFFRDHQQRRRLRYKCRSRVYVDSQARFFEVKLKGARGRTVKHRMVYDRDELSAPALAFLRDCVQTAYGRPPDERLEPALEVAYERVTLASPGERLTCDFDVRFGEGGRLAPDRVIVESKSAHGDARADRILRELGARPEPNCSKYCVGVALTNPSAKSNGMRRLLRRHFVVAAALLAFPAQANALPTVKIDTRGAIPNERKATAKLRMPGYQGRIGIERRGQSSQRFPKKSYSLELRDARGKDRKVPLLGMPADGDWILYAGYYDKTLMRNVVAYETARSIGRYAPRTRFVHLRLNGRYHGVYVLTEKVELGGKRVDGEALVEFTSSFQFRSKDPSFRGPVRRRPIVWEDPERGDMTRAEAEAVAAPVRAAERALYGPGSWRPFIDEAAAVDYVLLQELFKNQDAFLASTFLALREDGKLHFGPVWDFDIALGNAGSGLSQYSKGWILTHRHWAGRLLQDRRFARLVAARWRELRAAGLRRDVMRAIDGNQDKLRGSVGRNFRRWPILRTPVWPSKRARGSHAAEVRFLRRWMSRRIAWLDRGYSASALRSGWTSSASASASSDGGKCGFGIAITWRPAACAERIPASESSIAAARPTPSRRTTSS